MNILRLADFPSKKVFQNRSFEIEKYGHGITHVFPLSEELIDIGNTISVLAGKGIRYPRYENIYGINVYRTVLSMKPYYLAFGPAVLFNIKKIESMTGRVDIIHGHNPPLTYGYTFVKGFVKKPFVATVHGSFFYDLLESSIFLKMMVSRVDHFIAINAPSVNILKKLGVENEKISLIPTGVDTNIFRKIRETEKIVLYAGRLVDWKNVDVVIDIANAVKCTHPEVKFYIVGRGANEQTLKKRVKKLGLKNVFFVKNVSYERMPEYYSRASVLIAPHKFDSFGKVVLEALACETPVVATDFDVPSDIKRCGIFVRNPEDVWSMTQAVLEIVENVDVRKRLGRRGRRVVEKSYTWKKCAERNMDVYRMVV